MTSWSIGRSSTPEPRQLGCGCFSHVTLCFPPVLGAVLVCNVRSRTTGGLSSGDALEGGGDALTDPSAPCGPHVPELAFEVWVPLRAGGGVTLPTPESRMKPHPMDRLWAVESLQLEDKQRRELITRGRAVSPSSRESYSWGQAVFHSLIIKKNTSISAYSKQWKTIEVFPV